ncbi:phage tail protein [Streptomyces sp. MZ04]|uniref:phage tail protein n=1 Tax=Streptomyces sp. MZ04 TaxID=2559236 RepID=UPI00107ED989|nr:phage tail protein [Streptomyces sp. MZ04]TGB16025.1 phage tail protein [Streptomyces sp. MZ04]
MSRFHVRRGAARCVGISSALLLALAGTTVGAAAAPATPAPEGSISTAELQLGDALTAHNFRLQMDGTPVEYISEVSGLDEANHKVTMVRGMTHSPAVDRWIDDAIAGREGRLKNITLELLDYQDNPIKRYHFGGAFVERIDYPSTPGADTLTVRFFTLAID